MAIFPFLGGILGSLSKASILWYNSIAEKQATSKKHLESQTALLMLKAQLNPHFLFNSLNNIEVLIEENPRKASDYLTKFSDILRYVLYDTKEEESELARELEQIKNYIELQKIRTDNPNFVKFQVTGELENQKIAPMIFLPFIENAFKHSKNKTIDNTIDIEFIFSQSSIKMACRNYYEDSQFELIKSEGLGVETIKQRLNLLYPEKHILNIEKTEHWFNVTLIINL
jgi:LytS/YehU family sensor histidine kinase